MAVEVLRCPHCQSEAVVKYGKASNGKARFRCQQSEQWGRTFLRAYAYAGRTAEVKRQIVEMALNGGGVRDIARVLHVSPSPVMSELKKGQRAHPGQYRRRARVLSGRGDRRSPARRGSGDG